MTDTIDPQTEFTAEIAERTVVVTWPDNERGGATPPPDGWQEKAWEQSTLHEIDEGSITGCSVLRWRDDPRPDAELVAASLALVTGVPAAVSPPPATDRAADRDRIADAVVPLLLDTLPKVIARARGYEIADAVLSVLPSDGRAAYRQTADAIERMQGYPHLILPEEIVEGLRLLAAGAQPEPGSPAYSRRLAAGERDEQQAQQDGAETRDALMAAHVALAAQAGRDQAALARVRQLHDRLAEETDLASPDDSITRGAAAKRIATALDGWNPALLPSCDAEFVGGGHCAKPAGHRPPGSDDPHVPAAAPVAGQPPADTGEEAGGSRVQHSGPNTKFCVGCLSGEHERIDEEARP